MTFDDDVGAWQHYTKVYLDIRDSASDEVPLPDGRIVKAEIDIEEIPAIADRTSTLVIEQTPGEEIQFTAPVQIERIEKIKAAVFPHIAAAIPSFRAGKQNITPQVKREISRIKLVKASDDIDHRYLSINRAEGTGSLSGEPFPLDWDEDKVRTDANRFSDYFSNYEGAFESDVPRLQRDYFILRLWLCFSPLMCDMRSLAPIKDEDIIRYPTFAIVFGKSNCGKTSLIDTLMTSMFGKSTPVDKTGFTASRLRGLQQSYKRHPVFFDDIGRTAFRNHGRDIIKDELLPPVAEHPGFVLSMNDEPKAFPDEIVKRSLMIYTTTALPPHDEALRQRLQGRIQEIRRGISGHLYRRYLGDVMTRLGEDRLPDEWLALSSGVLSGIIDDSMDRPAPHWHREVSWLSYAEKRYDRVKARLNDLLRESARAKSEGDIPNGLALDDHRVIVWEQRDAFGRHGFDWEDVPSTLIDEDASSGGRAVLFRASLEDFLDRDLRPPRRWRLPWG